MLFMLNFWVCYQASEKQPPWAYRSLIIETDATMARDALEGEDYRPSAMGGIVTEVKHLLCSEFFFLFLFQCVLVYVIE
jgi:hypothetical protein